MQKELRNAIDQTRDVEGQIRSALQTPMKRDILWINWKKVLRERYNRVTGEHLKDRMVSYIRNRYGLNDMQYGRICRGHDFVQLLGMAMVHSDYSSKYIQTKIAESYDVADFSQTALSNSVVAFAARFGLTVLRQ